MSRWGKLKEKSIWENVKEIGLDIFVGKGRDLEAASTKALWTYLNSQLLDPKDQAPIKESFYLIQPINQLYKQTIIAPYHNRITYHEVAGIEEVSIPAESCMKVLCSKILQRVP